jgi:hypothetical protein
VPRVRLLGTQNPQIWAANVVIGFEPVADQNGLFCKLLAGCSLTVGVVTSCWKVASLNSRSPRWLGAGAG